MCPSTLSFFVCMVSCQGTIQLEGGSSTRISLVRPIKVKAHKSFLFTEKFPCIENKEFLIDFVFTNGGKSSGWQKVQYELEFVKT